VFYSVIYQEVTQRVSVVLDNKKKKTV